jgi:hypothetical protein
MNWEKMIEEIKTQNWIILGIMGVTAFLFMSSIFTLGVITGGLMIIANFNVLQRTVSRSFSRSGPLEGNKMTIIAKYYFRLAITGIIIYILITRGWVNPIGLAVGLSTVLISIMGIGIRAVLKTSS